MEEKKRTYIYVSMILSIGLVLTAIIIATTWRYVSRSNVTVSVTGSASKDLKSDYAIWNASYSNESASLQDAYSKLKATDEKVKNYLLSKGFTQDQIVLSAINTTTLYVNNEQGYPTNQITGYQLSKNITIESKDVDKIDKISREATELINEGVEINSPTPQFLYTKIGELKIEMIGLAAQDAKVRAEQIANSTNNSIGEVRSSKMGVIQINAKNSTEVSDYGMNNTNSIDKTITVVVNMSFSIK
jgi:hypothetical protein